jgi:hypothetical protein
MRIQQAMAAERKSRGCEDLMKMVREAWCLPSFRTAKNKAAGGI